MKKSIIGLLLAGLAGLGWATELTSPGEMVRVDVNLVRGSVQWSVKYNGIQIVDASLLGLIMEQPFKRFMLLRSSETTVDDTWKPVWDKFSLIRNHYKELTLELQEAEVAGRKLVVVVRAYDDSVAVRYHLPDAGEVVVLEDNTHFMFAGDFTGWCANGERPNYGPQSVSKFETDIPKPNERHFPLTLKVAEECYAAVLEAAIYDFNYMSPKGVAPNGIRTMMGRNKVTAPIATSWRVLLLGKTPGSLITNNALVNLNPPCQIKDPSWIETGLSLWDWRGWGATTSDGFTYELDMKSWRRQIDFASKYGVKYLLLDANWYGEEFSEDSNPVTSRSTLCVQNDDGNILFPAAPADWDDPIDVPALIQYAADKNVKILLYINDRAQVKYNFEKTLATYKSWGAAGIKYGFMRGKGQQKVLDTRKIVEACARHQLVCDFHDSPVPPSGDRRTWPNYITREFCHAQADAKRSFSPTTFCTAVFINMLAGPLDMSNGMFALNGIEKGRPRVFEPINSTVVAEAARVLITFTGMAIVADMPEAYMAKADLFKFLGTMPMNWDETIILGGAIGEYICTARRSGQKWWIGTACNEQGLKHQIKLDFLKKGATYTATIYEDAPDADYIKNREAYTVRKCEVKRGDVIAATLAQGGGHAIFLEPK
ncbi:MAG: glycoside hydrolase family 97 catalytic domain-containing protein [Kiritimatiellae bacterium]|nr:glycoside hydrolase family 97 catalytic domain-containing protein [Kiritimatiellia bacterium]